MSRTFVCGSLIATRAWCRRNSVEPYASTTHLITATGDHGRGLMLTPEDRVVFVGVRDESRLMAALVPAGLGTVVQPERA